VVLDVEDVTSDVMAVVEDDVVVVVKNRGNEDDRPVVVVLDLPKIEAATEGSDDEEVLDAVLFVVRQGKDPNRIGASDLGLLREMNEAADELAENELLLGKLKIKGVADFGITRVGSAAAVGTAEFRLRVGGGAKEVAGIVTARENMGTDDGIDVKTLAEVLGVAKDGKENIGVVEIRVVEATVGRKEKK